MKPRPTNDRVYFWLGEDGELEELNKEEFDQRQKEWKGVRPTDMDNG